MGAPGSIGTQNKIIVLFDGVCNLCNGAVQFVIKRDPAVKFLFASLQSDFGRSQLIKFGLDPAALHSIMVIEDNKIYERSDAAFRIVPHLQSAWRFLSVFKIFPKVMRDWGYDVIAKNRYTLFGRTESCMIPTPELKARFIG